MVTLHSTSVEPSAKAPNLGASSKLAQADIFRFARLAIVVALVIQVSGHFIDLFWQPPYLYNIFTLVGVLLLVSPAMVIIATAHERPRVRTWLVLAGLGLAVTVLLDLTKDIAALDDWALIGNNSAVRGHLRWAALVGGIFLLFASLYQAFNDLIRSRTQAQAARDYAQSLIHTANVIVIGLDAERRLQVYNEAAERITGYARSELPEQGWFDVLVPPERYPQTKEKLLRLADERLPRQFEGPIVTKSGEARLIAWSNSEIYEGGCFAGTISFGLDITERKRAEAELLRSSKLAALGVVAAGLAHEIGNPLASLSARLRLMEEDNDPAFWRESLQVLARQISRITRIVHGVRRFSRPLQPGMAECNVNILVSEAIEIVRFHERAKQCEIGTELAPDLPKVLAAGDQLVQVFLNLGLNAVEAMSAGGSLTVKTSASGPMVEVAFLDTGSGVSEDCEGKMFDTFYTTKEDGMGLGLSIARSIVANHSGRIACESRPEGGACFRVLLPACAPTAQPNGERA